MSLVFQIILYLLLVVAFVQDWKFRAIHWFVFPLLAVDSILIFFSSSQEWRILGLNLIFVSVILAVLFMYVSIRERKWTNIFERHFGIGDALFFIAIIPLFGSLSYMFFFVTGMIFSGVLHGIMQLKKRTETIPLAGYLALYLVTLKSISFFSDVDLFYQNQWP